MEGRGLSLETLERVARSGVQVALSEAAIARMEAGHSVVRRALDQDRVVYGINTGFGRLSDTRISPEQIPALQLNLVRSHAVGVGEPLPEAVVRAMTFLRVNTLAMGRSGVRPVVATRLTELLNSSVVPRVPCQGSVGASGDLAPLAHLALVLIGEGRARVGGGEWIDGAEALSRVRIEPLELEAKEGLALVNGTQLTTAIGGLALLRAERLLEAAEIAGALSLEAMRGTRAALREEIHTARPHPGQVESAARLRSLLGDSSEIGESHIDCDRVQDPYSIRCMPQVHGTVRGALSYVRSVLEIEINSATDNPLVFEEAEGSGHVVVETSEGGLVVSGGNFHAAPVAAALDFMGIVLVDLASISERRVEVLMDPGFSRLPAFLAPEPGLQSGFMMHQVTAAALVSESKGLSHPASVDSIPTSANKEDHVSMGPWAARKTERIVENAERVVAIELLAASQGIDLLRPMRTTSALEAVHAAVRNRVPRLTIDRPGSEDIEAIAELIREGGLPQVPRGGP